MDVNYIVSKIKEYENSDLRKPNRFNSDKVFMQRSYAHWAVSEIINALKMHRHDDPVLVIERFIRRMNRYSTYNRETSFIFSVAKDTAEVIEDLIISLEERDRHGR